MKGERLGADGGGDEGCEPAQEMSPPINFEALSVIANNCIRKLHGMF